MPIPPRNEPILAPLEFILPIFSRTSLSRGTSAAPILPLAPQNRLSIARYDRFGGNRWQVRLNQSYYKPHEIKGLAVVTRSVSLTWIAKQSIL